MISSISVKNYRSLKETTLSLGPLTVLIGANGSGKSNILDLLALVKGLTVGGQATTDAFASRGSYKEAVWGGEIDRDITIDLTWRDGSQKSAPLHTYSAQLGHDEAKDVVFEAERFRVPEGGALARATSGEVTLEDRRGAQRYASVDNTHSATVPFGRPESSSLIMLESMREWRFYRFDPALMRPPQQVSRVYALSETGANLSTVLHALFSDEDPVLDEIVELVQACVPTVQGLRSPIFGNAQTYVALQEESVPAPVGSWGLSDGTLLALALATAVLAREPPSLIVLESPDTHLHPHVMETLAEMLKLASQKTQVIATTHSPYLLNYLPPESLVVVEKHKGATECKPVKGRKGMKRVFELLSAGEAWYSGHIGGVP